MNQAEFERRFKVILDGMFALMTSKNHDYSGVTDPLANLRECEKAGIESWRGVAGVRMADKMSRIQNYCRSENLKVKDEGFKDTLRDLANYAILCMILFEDAQAAKGVNEVNVGNS